MASGVKVSPSAIEVIARMRKSVDTEQRIRVLIFGFKPMLNGKTNKMEDQIVVVEEITQKELDDQKTDAFKYMQDKVFIEKNCAYVLYDCKYQFKERGGHAELIFLMWCPMSANIGDRMKYASSQEALLKKVEGIKHKKQIHERCDVDGKRAFLEFLERSDICALEGEAVEL